MIVSELSWLGRSLGQIVAILDALAKAGVAFALFARFAEVERDLISERTREGLGRTPR